MKALEKLQLTSPDEIEDPITLLEETDLPDLAEVITYRKSYRSFTSNVDFGQEAFVEIIDKLYTLRNRIAHVKESFSALDLDKLLSIAKALLPLVGRFGEELEVTLDCIESHPERVVLHIPDNFYIRDERAPYPHLTNLPPADYDPDGGFVGRKDDTVRIENLVLGDVHRVITISGAGGVGKTALAHYVCQRVLLRDSIPFSAVVWVSAKEEALTSTGITPLEPRLRNYEDLLDNVLETFGWFEYLSQPADEKERNVDIILRANDKGVLLVMDNLETLTDDRVIAHIKDFPPPNKVLITSRIGLGEVERRYPLGEMSLRDSIQLLRTVALEKGAQSLVRLPDEVLTSYVERMARYPLAIKWVIGQVALGKDLDGALSELTSPTGDVARFSFEQIFSRALSDNERLVLFALSAYEKPITRGILSHLCNLPIDDLDLAITRLTIASLVIPTQVRVQESRIETQYDLLSLTRNFIRSKLMEAHQVRATLQARVEGLHTLLEESVRAARHYAASLPLMGAQSEEEKVAATWALTGIRAFQAGDYVAANQALERATQIAPQFAPGYREWADMESRAGFADKADELIRKAASLAPSDPKVWSTWGVIEMRRTRYDEASRHLSKALELNPSDEFTLTTAAEVEKRRENFALARDLFLKLTEDGDARQTPPRTKLIAYTSLADNMKRWAEAYRSQRDINSAIAKLREAFGFAELGLALDREDQHALDTFREIATEFGITLLSINSPSEALVYLKKGVDWNPQTRRAKRATLIACYYVASILTLENRLEDARRYFDQGRSLVQDGTKWEGRYGELALEFSGKRRTGKIVHLVPDKRYAFVEPDDEPGRTIFLHVSEMIPVPSTQVFGKLTGLRASFLLISTQKGPAARRVVLRD